MQLATDTRSRKWQLTVNNPEECGCTHDWIIEALNSFKPLLYWCMADEIGECGTYHTHVFVAFSSAVRFSSLKNKFGPFHMEMARGTSQENRDYIFKQGKWIKDKKGETNLQDTRKEFGDIPVERPGARNDLDDLYDMVKQGMSNHEIIDTNPRYMLNIQNIDNVRQMIRDEKFSSINRKLDVTYVYGETGLGKTHDIMDRHKGNICRVTDYCHPFDSYNGEDVLMFEEFRSSLKIGDMLIYLEGYPLKLPARYQQRVACYTKVYIVSNIPLEKQYENTQRDSKETWNAFLRRINTIKEYTPDGIKERAMSVSSWYLEQHS